ncbi:MAG TPA: hypothetical protein PL172_13975, partial [Thermomicrobiales bacterium]|nr:hypothetical protein [Thermomicrobiales bacterium]
PGIELDHGVVSPPASAHEADRRLARVHSGMPANGPATRRHAGRSARMIDTPTPALVTCESRSYQARSFIHRPTDER